MFFGSETQQPDVMRNGQTVNSHPELKTQNSPGKKLKSIVEKLPGVVVVYPVLSRRALIPGEEVGAEQAVEVNQDHDIHHYHGGQKVSTVVQPGVVVDDVPGEVELCAQTKRDVGEEVGESVDVVHGGGLSTRQLQHQPHVQGHAVDLYKQSDHSAGYIQLCVEGVQKAPDHLEKTHTDKWSRSHCYKYLRLYFTRSFTTLWENECLSLH